MGKGVRKSMNTQFYELAVTVKGNSKETIIELLKDAAARLSTEEFGDGRGNIIAGDRNQDSGM